MRYPWLTWSAFIGSVAVVLVAMGWITAAAWRLDDAEARAAAQAQFEEDVRLALWRIDAYLGTVVAQENARPYFMYSAFYSAQRAYGRMFNDANRDPGELFVASPLLTQRPPYAVLHFQFTADGRLSSPQVPSEQSWVEAEPLVPRGTIEGTSRRLDELRESVGHRWLAERVPRSWEPPLPNPALLAQNPGTYGGNWQRRNSAEHQTILNNFEYAARQQGFQQQAAIAENNARNTIVPPRGAAESGTMNPLWHDGRLLLARWVEAGNAEFLQGVWLDWPQLKSSALETVRGTFPDADLHAVPDWPNGNPDRLSAVLPLRFVPGPVTLETESGWTPTRISLLVAWACILLAALAAGILLLGVVRLSERRAAFVSAVTHELRTPLTTFRMYADMLADNQVPDPQRRQSYFQTLRVEAERLSHLVENVLAYARLERKGPARSAPLLSLTAVVDHARPRLQQRAAAAGMELHWELPADADQVLTRADPGVVEQILFNLVDNACKYAATATPPVIHIAGQPAPKRVRLVVRDHGPGISSRDERKLFQPFCKSAHQAAQSAPGIGLGLALSRRLARGLGGDLRLDPNRLEGAAFVLELRAG
jgi:signal transduction histidine kinase